MSVDTGRLAGQGTSMSRAVVNGKPCELAGPPSRSLLALLRSDLGLTGVKPGCGEGECGACTALVDGAPVMACHTKLADVAGRPVTTIEGLASGGGCTRSSRRSRKRRPPSAGTARRAWRCGPQRC